MDSENLKMMINVAIVDDHRVVAEGIEQIINKSEIAQCIGKVYSVKDCWEMLCDVQPDVLLLDIGLPDGSGLDLCPLIKEKYPSVHILMLTSYAEYSGIKHVMNNGASGYTLKNADSEEIVEGIRQVAAGKQFLCEEVNVLLHQKAPDRVELSRRERQLLKYLVEGMTSAQIANEMCLGYETIRTYRKNLIVKLGVPNTAALTKLALEEKMV